MAALVLDTGGPERLLNAYGPTETTTFATWFLVQQIARDARTVPIGRPIANSEAYVLDAAMNPVPVGVAGELYLGGDGLARGYWAQPALTADKFRPHPFDDRLGRRTRPATGVRQLPTGEIDLLGRIDQQVKIRGFRVELGAIETALMRDPRVRQAAVRSHRHGSHHRLVAYVVPHPGVELDTADLLAGLRESLPIYMIPTQVVQLDRLPLTTGGKLDRKRLPAPDSATVGPSSEPPRSAEERLLAELWKDILGASVVGVSDNYFELGGDSITAIQIASRIRRAGWDVDPSDIIRQPTIASLASGLRPLSEGSRGDRADATGLAPLTPVQRWFFDAHAGDLHHCNQSVLLRPRERLDVDALRAALQALYDHHDQLRATYTFTPQVEQHIQPAHRPVSLEVVGLASALDADRLLESHATQLQAGLTLHDGPLLKAALYRCGESDRLLLVAHHLVVDLMSWRILVEDLDAAYRQCHRGEGVIDLGAKSTSYKRWAAEIERFSTSPELLQERDYWAARTVDGEVGREEAVQTPNLFGHAQVAFLALSARDTARSAGRRPPRVQHGSRRPDADRAGSSAAALERRVTAHDYARGAWTRAPFATAGSHAHGRVVHHSAPVSARGSR
jgi:aryl carrier-like protein